MIATFLQGNILYQFPSLQRTASAKRVGRKEYVGKRWAELINGIDKYFKEKKWRFRSVFSSTSSFALIGLNKYKTFFFSLLINSGCLTFEMLMLS